MAYCGYDQRTSLVTVHRIFAASSCVAALIQNDAEAEQIVNLPGLTFAPNLRNIPVSCLQKLEISCIINMSDRIPK
ncbi:unnamed protein product [Onchocerca flexuosa]|uniref:Uncharacterized protein n=1 Tax=Onchocerca flexuosa TaxID=387005 RepID=A0A183H9B9_9BILA|nr:unnamed protein product [Onchocerca flexuosa]